MITMPWKVCNILDMLNIKGFESYIVGGCVRDSLLNKIPNDWDICTNATPQQVTEIFEGEGYKVLPTGIKHGTVTVIVGAEGYEVTTYRVDGKYSDSRRPDTVEFTTSLVDDLSRRDFTMNAIAYNAAEGLIDPFGGTEDMKNGKIVTVGTAEDRFTEDPLRMLRAVRFSSQLNMGIDLDTQYTIKSLASNLDTVSWERKENELRKILMSERAQSGITQLQMYSLMDHIVPEVSHKIIDKTDYMLTSFVTRMTYLLIDIKEAETVLRRLRISSSEVSNILNCLDALYYFRNQHWKITNAMMKGCIRRYGLANVKKAMVIELFAFTENDHKESKIMSLYEYTCRIIRSNEPICIKDLVINGNDIMKAGITEGKMIGEALEAALELVHSNPLMNEKDLLIKYVKMLDKLK